MTRYVYAGASTSTGRGTPHRPEGIFIYTMDPQTGALTLVTGVESGPNPSFLALHPSRRYLYCVNETGEGAASSFSIDPASGGLTRMNGYPVMGSSPCYISISGDGRWALVANYSSGNVSVLPIGPDGQLGELAFSDQHQGASRVNERRQEGPHAHSVIFDPTNRFALSADLGTDQIFVYTLDAETGALKPNAFPFVSAEPGAGPRHLAFHPNQRFLFAANELNGTVTAFAWDKEAGSLALLLSYPTLPEDFKEYNLVADIHLTPDGRYLYVSNRGHNSLAVFEVNAETGDLRQVGDVSCGGNWPRNFALDPEGNFIIVANQESSTLNVFQVDQATGMPTPVGEPVSVPNPMFAMVVDF